VELVFEVRRRTSEMSSMQPLLALVCWSKVVVYRQAAKTPC
jgi:hypothetical protein